MKRAGLSLLLLAAVGLSVWAVYLEPSSLTVKEYPVEVEDWSPRNRPIRLAVLADLHVGSPFNGLEKLKEIVTLTNSQKPDLILLAGDYVVHGVVGGHRIHPREIAPVLGRLTAPLGVYAVLGNHDQRWGAVAISLHFTRAGILVLEDKARHITGDGIDFWLVGLTDFWRAPPDVEKAIGSIPDGAEILAFTHNPDVFPELPPRVALTLAGHTHGGQVSLPIVGAPIVPSRYGQRYVSGLTRENGHLLFVSTGLGTSIFPIRLGVPPEISIVDIR